MSSIVKGETFTDEPVEIDGKIFFNCKFIRCTLIYSGGPGATFEQCTLDSPKLSLHGPAENTLAFLHSMYHSPFKQQVENTFEMIRRTPVQTVVDTRGQDNGSQ